MKKYKGVIAIAWSVSEVMKINPYLLKHIDLTFDTVFVPRIWLQVSDDRAKRCQLVVKLILD